MKAEEPLCVCPCCVRINNLLKESMEKALIENAKTWVPDQKRTVNTTLEAAARIAEARRCVEGCGGHIAEAIRGQISKE